MCNFKAFLTSKVLSLQCSVSETGNISSHKSWRGCRSNFHLLSGAFPLTLPTAQLSRSRPFFLLGLGEKTLLCVKCFVICQNNNFIFPSSSSHPTIISSAVKLLYSSMILEVTSHSKRKKMNEICFPNFILLQPITILSLLILWAVVHRWSCHQKTTGCLAMILLLLSLAVMFLGFHNAESSSWSCLPFGI